MAATAPAGLKTANLTITHAAVAGAGGNYVIPLTGVAEAQSLALAPNPLVMAPQTIGFASAPAPGR